MRRAVLLSLLIHLLIGALLLVGIRREEQEDLLPPPSAVTMVFESGRKNGPTLPNPDLQAIPSAPPAPVAPPTEETPVPAPAVPTQSPPSSQPAPEPSEPAPPPVEVAPVPPPPPAELAPLPPPPPAAKPLSEPRAARVRPPVRHPPSPKPPDFPAPMDFSFGKPLAPSPSPARPHPAPHIPGTIDMSLGPASRGAADTTPYADRDEEAEGADWRNALSRWVSEHAYYPEQARRDGEEGDAKVHVVVEPNGQVKLVELIGKSGSVWLDLALLALFRDQHIPPLPYGMTGPFDFNFTMHYVIIRPR